jgi:arylsulfatase A-like enzyme
LRVLKTPGEAAIDEVLQMGRLPARMRAQLRETAFICSGPVRPAGQAQISLAVSSAVESSNLVRDILATAVGLGLVVGLVEGTSLWALQRLRWLRGPITFLGGSLDAIWVSTLFDLLLFGGVGLALILLARLVPRFPLKGLSAFVLACLTIFDWLALPLLGRIRIYGVMILAVGLAVEATRQYQKREDAVARFWRQNLPRLGALALLVVAGIPGGMWLQEQIAVARLPQAAPDTPNILVIVVDTLRADHLSGYGYARPTSPNLDRLAEQGVLFENAFSTSPWTKPSHASLLTGRYPHEHGADAAWPLDGRYPTIGEALQTLGYRTGAFSANYETFNRISGLGRGFQHFEDFFRSVSNMVAHTFYGRMAEYYLLHHALGLEYRIDRSRASGINRSVLRWIDEGRGKPFFALLNYYDSHAPYIPPQPYRSQFSQEREPGGRINTDWGMDHIYVPMTPEQLQGEVDAYDGAIAYVDDHIGKLLAELQRRGLTQNTLVVITSDHGESFGEHGLLEHNNSLYREVIHVPLIFWWPGRIPAGARITQIVTNAALPATLLDLIGGDEGAMFPGPSLAQLWEEPDVHRDWPYPLAEVAQIPWVPPQHLTSLGAMKSVLSPQWQYIEHEILGAELYDWQNDRGESHNLIKYPEMQPVVDRLRTYLKTLLASASQLSR